MRNGEKTTSALEPAAAQLLVIEDAPPQLPDFQVINMVTTNNRTPQGRKVTITCTVSNTGKADAGASLTPFTEGVSLLGLVSTPVIAAGGSVTVSLDWYTAAQNGKHTLSAMANGGRAISESDYDDNTTAITVTMLGNQIR